MQRQFLWRFEAPAADQQVIAETLETVEEILHATTLKVDTDRLGQRHTDIGARHQVGVKSFDGRQAEEEAVGLGSPALQAIQAVGKRARRVQTGNDDLSLWQQLVEQRIDGLFIGQATDLGARHRGKAVRQRGTRSIESEQVGIGLAEHQDPFA